ncbi:MAG: alpha-galactosidase [Clostridia bacterium]|nr:alpha-galactosidase [Clostridia bacterium]
MLAIKFYSQYVVIVNNKLTRRRRFGYNVKEIVSRLCAADELTQRGAFVMVNEYKDSFYVSFNAEDNAYYHASRDCSETAAKLGAGTYEIKEKGAKIIVTAESAAPGKSSAVLQHTVLENTGSQAFTVNNLSAAYLTGIGCGGTIPWKKHRFIIHYAYSCWQGEAQWRHVFAEDAGLYRTYNHGTQSTFRLQSKSSWSTSQYEPLIMIEDTELNKTWYVQLRCGNGWAIEAGVRGYRNNIELGVVASDCFEWNNCWSKTLAPGEKLATCEAVTGVVEGGFEEAAADVTLANRAFMKTCFPAGTSPLCYNDYMNALWALPNRENTIPLIDAAAKAGAEYYVMDAGWYKTRGNGGELLDIGAWEINDELFGEGGLQGIFDYVRAKGMLPGIWLEIESASAAAPVVRAHPEYVLKRNGHPAGGGRQLLDFRVKGVREYIRGVIDRLYSMGVRFIKNDYNANTGPAVDPSGAESVREHSKQFEQFIDDVRLAYPDLIIENCGSGAMRSDMGTLSHFHLQSVSDQEDYFRLPSIVTGSEVCYPPERCGIWAYPYPTAIDYRESFKPSPEFTAKFADAKNTVYNMVTGLAGLMYLSGRIECADDKNMRLIRNAAELYKRYRDNIAASVPVFPSGTFDIDSDGVNTYGLIDRGAGLMFLFIWNNGVEAVNDFKLDLSKYAASGIRTIDEVYPRLLGYRLTVESSDHGTVIAMLPSGPSALYAVLKI